jgi:diguanylate cyclase (GGDEF)-like protein
MTFKDFRWHLWRRTRILTHARRDDELYNYLVGSLFTSQSSLNSANFMGTAIALTGFALTGNRVFLVLSAIALTFGIARTLLFHSFIRNKDKLKTRADGAYYESRFVLFSVLFTAAFGMSCYELIQYPGAHAIANGAAVGYGMGVVARNAGRPSIVIIQVLLMIVPMIFGFAMLHNTYGDATALLLIGTIITTIAVTFSLHKNVIAVYNADKATRYLAMNDSLTGLMNRYTFGEELAHAITDAPHKKFAILYLDLDRFKDINDTLGHTAGDAVIIEVARRLRAVTRSGDLIARFGGDEFLVKIDRTDVTDINEIVKRIVTTLTLSQSVDGKVFAPSASIGVAFFPENGLVAGDIIKKADIALYEAKRAGGKTFRIFVPDMENDLHAHRTLRNEIELAVKRREFVLHYQPIYELGSRNIIAVEALLRWNHPTRGLLRPDAFIPVAEETRAIIEIGEQVIDAACTMAARLPEHIAVAINLSTIQFCEPERLVNAVRDSLQSTGLRPSRLHLEITESLLLANTASTRKTLEALTATGAKLSLDDFGTGYSSLSYILDFPFSKIKIDKKFTGSLMLNTASHAIIKAVAQLAADLSLEVVVEGIETPEQEIFVRTLGPTQGQGYLFSIPLASEELLSRLARQAGNWEPLSLAS